MHGFKRFAFAASAICAFASAAMAADPVNIQDPIITARVARVDAGNRLAVQEVPPSSFFHTPDVTVSGTTCIVIAAAPTGKALIVRQIRVVAESVPTTSDTVIFHTSSDCSGPSWQWTFPVLPGQNIVTFDPGLAIPEGTGLSALASGNMTARSVCRWIYVRQASHPPGEACCSSKGIAACMRLARCALAALTICASASAAMAAGQVNIQDPAMAMREARVDAGRPSRGAGRAAVLILSFTRRRRRRASTAPRLRQPRLAKFLLCGKFVLLRSLRELPDKYRFFTPSRNAGATRSWQLTLPLPPGSTS